MLEVCLKKALSIGVCNAAKQTEVQALIESATSHYTQLCSNFSGPGKLFTLSLKYKIW